MMMDRNLMMSEDQSIAQAAGTYLSDRSIDLGTNPVDTLGNTPIKDLGRGLLGNLSLLVQITEAVTSAGASTTDFQLIMADNGPLTTNKVVLQTTGAIGKATLVKGYQPRLALPVGISKRFLGVQYVVATATQTAGKVTATLVEAKQTNPKV